MKQLQRYTYTLPPSGTVQIPAPNDNFHILAATGPVTVRGDTFGTFHGLVAGQGLKGVPFNRLELFDESGAPNTVTVLITPAEFVNQVFSGAVTVTSPRLAVSQAEYASNFYATAGAIAANTPATILAPGANVNGAIIVSAEMADYMAADGVQSFVARGSAPANVADGQIICMSSAVSKVGAGVVAVGGSLRTHFRINAGAGIYFISSVAGSGGGMRHCSYILL